MAFSKLYVCDQCHHDVVLVHAEEWAANENGEGKAGEDGFARPYPGFGLIGGLQNWLWCLTCRAVRPHVFVRLSPPATHAVVAYAEAQRLGRTGYETGPCPVCSSALTWEVDGETCPACATGHLQFTGEWEQE